MVSTIGWLRTCLSCVGLGIFTFVFFTGTQARADIVITDEDLLLFQEAFEEVDNPIETTMLFPVTDDGRQSVEFDMPHTDKGLIYEIDVTQLPAGATRFPIAIDARMTIRRDSGLGIRNLTIDPEPDPALQASYCIVAMSERGTPRSGGAIDDLFNQDLPEDIGAVGERDPRLPTVGTDLFPSATVTTENATLELQLGVNRLRIEPTNPADVAESGEINNQTGFQVFTITIGPGVTDLQGAIVPGCSVRRQISPKVFAPTETVTVTLDARGITGATTITETFPVTWTVDDAGGGTPAGNTLAFDITADAEIRYQLFVPAGFCELAEFSGVSTGACAEAVAGTQSVDCMGIGGIRLTGDDLANKIINPGSAPTRVTTIDGRVSLNMDQEELNGAFPYGLYRVNVTQLPAGVDRFPVLVVSRQIADNSSSIAIRNLTIDSANPGLFREDDDLTSLQDSFLSIRLMDDGQAEARDERWVDLLGLPGDGEDPRGTLGRSGTRRDDADGDFEDDAELSTLDWPEGVTKTNLATLQLVEGENLLGIDATDVRDLPTFGPDYGHVIFDVVIGPDEPDLIGGIDLVEVLFVRADANGDGGVNIADVSFVGNFVFGVPPATAPPCEEAADANDDGSINIADPSFIANFVFGILPATPPPAPFPDCGPDPSPGALPCGTPPIDCIGG